MPDPAFSVIRERLRWLPANNCQQEAFNRLCTQLNALDYRLRPQANYRGKPPRPVRYLDFDPFELVNGRGHGLR